MELGARDYSSSCSSKWLGALRSDQWDLCSGPNKQARLQTAKAVIERFVPDDVRSGRVPQQPANETKIPRRLTTLFIQTDQSMYGVPPQELLSEMHSQLDSLHLPSAFKVHLALTRLWWSPSTHSLGRQASENCETVLQAISQFWSFSGCRDIDLSSNDYDDEFIKRLCKTIIDLA